MRVVLAFSGGLDTSWCVVYLREALGAEVTTVTVDTGGVDADRLAMVEARARALGAVRHVTVDGRQAVFDRFVAYLIKANCLRGGTYPVSVGAERVVQAEEVARIAREIGADAVAHGSTGAGNDQVRFDVAFHVLLPGTPVLAPIREKGLSRKEAVQYLTERGHEVEAGRGAYSVNEGLWGTTIGGAETHDPWKALPEEAYVTSASTEDTRGAEQEITIGFHRGIPRTLDNEAMDGVRLVTRLNEIGRAYGIGRGVHVGDTILGIKGRIAFEAPAPAILIAAHREVEKLVLTRWQAYWKDVVGQFYGGLLHEALWFDPVARDIEAFIDSTQQRVTGDARVRLMLGNFRVVGTRSPHSLLDERVARYGEANAYWDGRDAEGFSRIWGLQGVLAARRDADVPAATGRPATGEEDPRR